MGLSLLSIRYLPPRVGDVANNGLTAWIYVDMLNSDLLLPAAAKLGVGLELNGEGAG